MRTNPLFVSDQTSSAELSLRQPTRLRRFDALVVAGIARDALSAELETWPKPGLVSPIDPGSHADMDVHTFRRSIAALHSFFIALAKAGNEGVNLNQLRRIGIQAEGAMLAATSGVNTHRGAIFALGLLCAAAGRAQAADAASGQPEPMTATRLTGIIQRCWGSEIMHGPVPESHGTSAQRRFGAGGARAEASTGFPHARWIGLPALRAGRAVAGNEDAAKVQAFFALLASVEDTNLLHRGGLEGMRYARTAAEAFIAEGGVANPRWLARATEIHRDFVERRLSPGGSADLLAVTIFLDRIEGQP